MKNNIHGASCIEICAGGGGQALGLEQAGFTSEALVEIDSPSCDTLLANRPNWRVLKSDVREFDARPFRGIDLLAGGVPCPPFSIAGKQLGSDDDRDLFPEALRIVDECRPKVVMLENVRGFLSAIFQDYRVHLKTNLEAMGYKTDWHLLNACDFGVSQLRPRVVIVAIQKEFASYFHWPHSLGSNPPTVGELLYDKMGARGWRLVNEWREKANDIAPTLVGGSKKHGGADLGPTRSKRAWASLGVDGKSLANLAPDKGFFGDPKLTVEMTARIQGFPDEWKFQGKKTATYRQIGNAFPPPVAKAVGAEILASITHKSIINMAV